MSPGGLYWQSPESVETSSYWFLVIFRPAGVIEHQSISRPPSPVPVPRVAHPAGQALACPLFLPPGAVEAPVSRAAAGRRAAMRSTLDAGGAAP